MILTNRKVDVHILDILDTKISADINKKYLIHSKENLKKLQKEHSSEVLYYHFVFQFEEKRDIEKYLLPIFDLNLELLQDKQNDLLYRLNDSTIVALIDHYYKRLNGQAIRLITSYVPKKQSTLYAILELLNNIEELGISKKYINLKNIIQLCTTKKISIDLQKEFISILGKFVKKTTVVRYLLLNSLKNKDYEIRLYAIRGLKKLVMKESIKKAIKEMENDHILDIRSEVQSILSKC